MTSIFNLSYDISKNLADENRVPENERLTSNDFVQKLCKDGVISLWDSFSIEGETNEQYHIVLRPIETSIMFYSRMTIEEINEYLNRFSNQMYYLLTEVKDEQIKGYAHIDYSHQNPCDDSTMNMVKEKIQKVVKHVVFKLKKSNNL